MERKAVRVLPVDPTGAVLLLRCSRPDTGRPFLITIGGGLDPGETEREAAVREVWEETGWRIRGDELQGPLYEAEVSFDWDGVLVRQHQRYYALTTDRRAVSFDHLDDVERATTTGHGWWTAAQLAATDDEVPPDVHEAMAALDRFRP